ncbi:hypothetical protein [Nonomuraea typhae]|uniref:DUF2269 family protein n=1 Tax=Nonomuraea typhae TaxID=2603600 RepID=A0ABW7Z8Y8_9ACTN
MIEIAALVTWLITALGGFYMLGTWIARGGVRQNKTGDSRLPTTVVFGHFLLAAAGLVVWIVYLFAATAMLAWIAFGLLVPVALLGFALLLRWIPVRRESVARHGVGAAPVAEPPAERGFPVAIVVGHGLFAVATVVLVLVSALG